MSEISAEDAWIAPKHDPFDAPDAEDEADTRDRVLEGGEDAGDGDAARVREELGLDDESGEPDPLRRASYGRSASFAPMSTKSVNRSKAKPLSSR